MWIYISGWQIVDLGTLGSLIVTRWHGWRSAQRWHRFWCRLSVSVGWRCTHSFAPPVCQQILCGAVLARKASVRMVLTKHKRVSFYRSFQLFMPRKPNSPLLLFLDFGTRFLDEVLRNLHCGVHKPSCGHFGHIQGQAHVGLFQLYPTSLPWHSSRHVGNLQENSCCF